MKTIILLRNTLKILLLFLATCCLFVSCKDDDFSTNPAHKLSFSKNVLSFDTLFTTVGSTTRTFMVYNKNNRPLRISEIRLPNNSMFRMNVDGVSDNVMTNVEIRAKDSMFVFVEVTIDPRNESLPFLVEDSIMFYTNTNVQHVKLTAYGQDAVIFRNRTLPDTTLLGEKPYLIFGDLIAENLTIEENSRLFFRHNANLIVNGNLRINGTREEPVIFRGDRLDNFLQDYKYDDLPGQWGGIVLASEHDHYINFAHIRNGKTGIRIDSATLKIENSMVHNFDGYGIKAKHAEIWIGNSLIANCSENCLQFIGGKHDIIQSTIANFYSNLSADTQRKGVAVLLTNSDGDENVALSQVTFINSIVYGSFQNEITLRKKDDVEFNYSFQHCLLRARESDFDENNLLNIIWNENPEFVNTKFPYDFRLKTNSPAIDKGDPAILLIYPYDLAGNLRTGNPDLGAYKYIAE